MSGPIIETIYRFNRAYLDLSNLLIGIVFDPKRDIVLVTGGASGLGKEITMLFHRTGAKVVVFDINLPDISGPDYVPDVHYFVCDVSNKDQIREQAKVVSEIIGTVTILINNAGITNGDTLLQLSFEQIEKAVQVNLLSSFYTIKTFLPKMLNIKRGYIITIASTLGYMSPARLSAYGASKSGLTVLHESLTYELGSPSFNTTGVKTLLVCPGQLKTKILDGIRTPSTILAPELEPKQVANEILKAVKLGKSGEMKLPFYGTFLPIFKYAPWPLVAISKYCPGTSNKMKKPVGITAARGLQSSSTLLFTKASESASIITNLYTHKATEANVRIN